MISLLNLKPRLVQNYAMLQTSLNLARRKLWVPPFAERKRRVLKLDDFKRTKHFKVNQVINVTNLDISDWAQLYASY